MTKSTQTSPVDRYTPYRELAVQLALDAIVLVPGANFNRLYNQGFHQNERPLLVLIPQEGLPAAIVPNLELGSFEGLGFEGNVFDWRDQDGYQSAFNRLVQHLSDSATGVSRIGVEGQSMRVFVHHALKSASPELELVDAQQEISGLRIAKNSSEIEAMEKAVAISENALSETIEWFSVGMTEKEIESHLIQQLFGFGAEDMAFGPIVAAGDNSAMPHAHARADYRVQAGDALLIDFGARYGGVCADITRTFFVQHCSDESEEVYQTVLNANLVGHDVSKPGITAHDVDDAVTSYLEQSNYADRIRHKTGHGLGRDIHEDPYIMRGNSMSLIPGMVFTIEPGLYELGKFGVRIEDDVVVTDSGVRSLTSFPKALTLIG